MTIKTPTINQINEFAASVVSTMNDAELDNWESLSNMERQSIVWSTWMTLNNAKAA